MVQWLLSTHPTWRDPLNGAPAVHAKTSEDERCTVNFHCVRTIDTETVFSTDKKLRASPLLIPKKNEQHPDSNGFINCDAACNYVDVENGSHAAVDAHRAAACLHTSEIDVPLASVNLRVALFHPGRNRQGQLGLLLYDPRPSAPRAIRGFPVYVWGWNGAGTPTLCAIAGPR